MNRLFKVLSLGILILFVAKSQSSQETWTQPHFFNGTQLNQACETDMGTIGGGVGVGVCLGYIIGVVDAYSGVEAHAVSEDGSPILPLCLPDSMSTTKVVEDIVVDFMKQHPESLKNPATSVVIGAMRSFACKTGWPNGLIPPNKR
jgi:hypothetical protein